MSRLISPAASLAVLALAGCASQPSATPPHRAQLVTEIPVRQLKTSIAFYEQLGFRVAFTEATFAELQWQDGHKLFLSQQKGPLHPGRPSANLRIGVARADDYWQVAQKIGAKVLTPIGDRFYHERDFVIADPDGFPLRFASLLPGGKW